ncbi:MAG: hypothetical protein MZW92_46055 [Comamonadaceae bacterium]|nr:hypothetical protein [Comamonadaceae bacterium]
MIDRWLPVAGFSGTRPVAELAHGAVVNALAHAGQTRADNVLLFLESGLRPQSPTGGSRGCPSSRLPPAACAAAAVRLRDDRNEAGSWTNRPLPP